MYFHSHCSLQSITLTLKEAVYTSIVLSAILHMMRERERDRDFYLALSPGLMLLSVFHSSSWSWYTSSTQGWQPDPQHSPGRGSSGGSGRRVRSSSSCRVSATPPSGISLPEWPSPALSLNVECVPTVWPNGHSVSPFPSMWAGPRLRRAAKARSNNH